jgi:phage terminase large subunit-like protein
MKINKERAESAIRFVENLIVPSGEGAGKPFQLLPFQKDFLYDVYGKTRSDGRRIVRRAILSIGRKNGKSVLIAALALLHLIGREAELNGEIYSAATEREQAANIFKYASQIVEMTPELKPYLKVVASTKTIVSLPNGSFFRALSAEAGSKMGLNPTVVIYDELAQAKNRDLYDALDTAMAARQEPLFITISTQSKDPTHILSQIIDDGLGDEDPTTVCHLYEVPEDEENIFDSEEVWKMANPALGVFRSLEEMRVAAERARRMPSFEATFRNLYLNQRIDQKSPLIPRVEWNACQTNNKIEDGADVYCGLDLSGTTDLCALVLISADEKRSIVQPYFWKPKELVDEHERRDRVPYEAWVRQGYIDAPDRRSIDMGYVANKIAELSMRYNIVGIAYDRWRIEFLLKEFEAIGLDVYHNEDGRAGALRLVSWGQGFKDMSPAIDALEISVLERELEHNGNPVLTWNISNAIAVSDSSGNRKLDKSKARFRIDGAVALAMAVGLKASDLAKMPEESAYLGLSVEEIKNKIAF